MEPRALSAAPTSRGCGAGQAQLECCGQKQIPGLVVRDLNLPEAPPALQVQLSLPGELQDNVD